MNAVLSEAREILKELTPLKTDCGRCCGAVCCQSSEAEETGMLLFPGEEAGYRDIPGYTLKETEMGTLLICNGTCDRDLRPLACRIFPLLPVIRGNEIRVVTDLRAKGICPLAKQGKMAMDPAFTEAVGKAGELLASDPEQKTFMMKLTAEQDELKQLRSEWSRM